jgi:hypothetical protein
MDMAPSAFLKKGGAIVGWLSAVVVAGDDGAASARPRPRARRRPSPTTPYNIISAKVNFSFALAIVSRRRYRRAK